MSVFSPVQLHYTAAPMMANGLRDPVRCRSGFRQGARDAIDLQLSPETLAGAVMRAARAGEKYKMSDPALKPGIVGAFCSVFTPADLADLLPDHFTHSERDGRFDWLDHTPGGVFLAGGGHGLVSTHNTAPTGTDRCRNIFDFIRLQLFGRLDVGVPEDTKLPALPSSLAMERWVAENCPEVMDELREQPPWPPRPTAEDDFAGIEDDDGNAGGAGAGAGSGANRKPLAAAAARGETALPGGKVSAFLAAGVMLSHPEQCKVHLAFDTFTRCLMFRGIDEPPSTLRPLGATDLTQLRNHLHRLGVHASEDDVFKQAHVVGAANAFDSLADRVNSLRWDGKARVETSLSVYFSTENTAYTRAVALYLWTALAGRALQPGIKVDMVPVLVGGQGLGKSRGVAALALHPDAYVSVSLKNVDRETQMRLQGRSVVEMAELRGLRQSDRDELKDFITQLVDVFRAPYGRAPESCPRRCVFLGTTNDHDILADPTGHRRWLPLDMRMAADVTGLIQDRDQLWAEAAVLFGQHGVMWTQAESLATGEHERFVRHDLLRDAVHEWVSSPATVIRGEDFDDVAHSPRDGFSMREVLQHLQRQGLILTAGKGTEGRIAEAFAALGIVKRDPRGEKPARVRGRGPPRVRIVVASIDQLRGRR